MKKARFIGFVYCLLFACLITGCQDHFKVYIVDSLEVDDYPEVILEDQFDRESQTKEQVKLSAIEFFANPVSKNGGKIRDTNAHLTWYRFEEQGPERTVTFKNQFDTQTWRLGRPVYLLVPTEKREPGTESAFPRGLDHFKCYEVLSEQPPEREVTLEDQFDKKLDRKEVVTVRRPKFFCNPVQKNDEEIKAPKNHLACYLITSDEGFPSPLSVSVKDQFGENTLTVKESQMLCVPSEKLTFETSEQ